jgi:hypothetical protein
MTSGRNRHPEQQQTAAGEQAGGKQVGDRSFDAKYLSS